MLLAASFYAKAKRESESVQRAVADGLGISISGARKFIKAAKDAGFIESTERRQP